MSLPSFFSQRRMKMSPTALPNRSKWKGPRGESVNDTAHLSEKRRVVRCHQRRPQFVLDPPALVLEDALKPADLLIAIGKIVSDGDHRLVFEVLAGIVGERVQRLGRAGGRSDEVRVGFALGHVLG